MQAKLDKTRQKAQEKAQINDIRRLAIGNRQIGAYKDILSDPVSIPSSDPPNPEAFVPIHQTPATQQSINSMLAVRREQQAKKQALANRQANNINRRKASTVDEEPEVGSDNSVTSKASRAARASRASRASQRQRSLTPPPVQMDLIRPGKRRVKVTANAVENTPSKRMKFA